MRYFLAIIIALSTTEVFAQQDSLLADTSLFYRGKTGIYLVSTLSRADIAGSYTFYSGKWDYTTLTFKPAGRFEQRSWLSCGLDRFDDSGYWKLLDPRTVEIVSGKQRQRFNMLQSEGASFLVPYGRALEFIETVSVARDIKRGNTEGYDRETLFLYSYDGGIWKRAFYRTGRLHVVLWQALPGAKTGLQQ